MNGLDKYQTISSDGRVTHVVVPVEEFQKLSGAGSQNAELTGLHRMPSEEDVREAVRILNDPNTVWYDGEEVLRDLIREGLIDARKRAGLTQAELASQVGLSQAQISRLESNMDGATVRVLRRIAEALGNSGTSPGPNSKTP